MTRSASANDVPDSALRLRVAANITYGETQEALYIAGHELERAFIRIERLLDGDGWRHCGASYTDVNAFIGSLRLDQFRPLAEDRKRIARRIKKLQPAASSRAIGEMMGVAGRTIDRDIATTVATNVAAVAGKTQQNQSAAATNSAHGLAGIATNVAAVAGKTQENQNRGGELLPPPPAPAPEPSRPIRRETIEHRLRAIERDVARVLDDTAPDMRGAVLSMLWKILDRQESRLRRAS
jgi:hypothetical protein